MKNCQQVQGFDYLVYAPNDMLAKHGTIENCKKCTGRFHEDAKETLITLLIAVAWLALT